MNTIDPDALQLAIEKKQQRKVKAKNTKHKVSGASVKTLQRIITKRGRRCTRRRSIDK